ncbi:MAG: TatD family hydrolase [Phycisphaeraceae bacterium]|nr:TatD family hydrolase [Phycisphaeraceae bacterium]
MIDTHCHLTYEPLLGRVEDVVAQAKRAGVDRMISVGTSPDDARLALGLTRRFDNIWSTVGVHPHYSDKWLDRGAVDAVIDELAAEPRVVALGEMGLDRHYPDPPMEVQCRALSWQLEAAHRHAQLPIIIHNREATDETLAILRDSGLAPSRFVFHCFTGRLDELEAILAFGAMVSFTGITTFPSATYIADAAARMPLDRIMIETDSPYLTPEPHRKVRPNEPKYVADVAAFIARRRDMAPADFVATVDANADRFFRLQSR